MYGFSFNFTTPHVDVFLNTFFQNNKNNKIRYILIGKTQNSKKTPDT